MNYSNYSKGSEWRKWDLHVHTPASFNYIGDWHQFETQLSKAVCDVIGINDYFTVAGYKKIREAIDNKKLDIGARKILPVVEMRMSDTLQNRNSTKNAVTHFNFHIIFNDSLNTADIENFIKSLPYKGATISEDYDDKEELKEIKVSFSETIRKLDENRKFKDNFLIWLPYDEYGGIDPINPETDAWIKENFCKKSHILGSSNEKQIDFFLWKSPLKQDQTPKYKPEDFQKWFGNKKPCIKGSDSHKHDYPIGKLKDSSSDPIKKFCWIKSDPTFEGLRQIIYEPEDRVRIQGEKPEIKRPYSVIESVRFIDNKNKGQFRFDDHWIDLNPQLNSIIGGKSSGKSILLYHIAKTIQPERLKEIQNGQSLKYSFEDDEGFDFEVKWADEEIYKLKDDSSKKNRPITYIPQLYLNLLAEEKKQELNDLVDNMLKNNYENYKEFREKINKEKDAIKNGISKEIQIFCKNRDTILIREKELKELGDEKAIKKNLRVIDGIMKKLREESQFTQKEDAKYSKLCDERKTNQKELNKIKQLIQIIDFSKSELESYKKAIGEYFNDLSDKIDEEFPDALQENKKKIKSILQPIEKLLKQTLSSQMKKNLLVVLCLPMKKNLLI